MLSSLHYNVFTNLIRLKSVQQVTVTSQYDHKTCIQQTVMADVAMFLTNDVHFFKLNVW